MINIRKSGLLLSSWWSVWEACSSTVGVLVPKILSLVIRVCTAASLLWYVYLCVRLGRRALNRSRLSLVMAYLS